MEFTICPFETAVHIKCAPPPDVDHTSAVNELREQIKECPHYDASYCTDHQLLLFLVARNFDISASHSMMEEALQWRAFRKPHEYLLSYTWREEIYKETETGKLYIPGNDRWGRPLLIFDNSVQNTSCPDAHMRLLSWGLEFSVNLMSENVDKYMIFMHMGGFSMFNSPSYKEIRETILMLCTCYPERLGHCIVFEPPAYFSIIFNTVKMFIDTKTHSKIIFISGDTTPGSENDVRLQTIIGENWRELTGAGKPVEAPNCSPGYNHEKHWPTVLTRADAINKTNK